MCGDLLTGAWTWAVIQLPLRPCSWRHCCHPLSPALQYYCLVILIKLKIFFLLIIFVTGTQWLSNTLQTTDLLNCGTTKFTVRYLSYLFEAVLIPLIPNQTDEYCSLGDLDYFNILFQFARTVVEKWLQKSQTDMSFWIIDKGKFHHTQIIKLKV